MPRRELTREQAMRRARVIQALDRTYFKWKFRLSGPRLGVERFLDTDVGRVRTLWYGCRGQEPKPLVCDLHGGGFMLMSADVDEPFCREFVEKVGCCVVSIDYAKAPRHPYPVAADQTYAVVKHLVDHAAEYGINPARLAIVGHSAGGNLAAVTALRSLTKGEFSFRCQILDYPVLDLATSPYDKPSPKGSVPPWLATLFDRSYITDLAQARDPYVSPVYASLEELVGLPPALIIVAGRDSLHDEAVKYAERLHDAGVETELREFSDQPHGFTYKPGRATEEAVHLMADFLRKHLG